VTLLGAIAAGLSITIAIVAARGSSMVERRLQALARRPIAPDAPAESEAAPLAKVAGCLAGALAGCVIAWALGLGIVPVALLAYVGWIAPSLLAARDADRRRRDAERAMVTLLEWLHALVSSGRPIESALVSIAERGSGSELLDSAMRRVRRDYTLGVPLRDALIREGVACDIAGLVELAARLDRARDLGRGVLPMLADLRDDLRAGERARGLQAASHVEGKLTLVLTLCYLPALALLVMIPLFLTLLAGLFG
jgi:Flp pilus assembly protein TadB